MTEANVSLTALYNVSSALKKFRTDTERLDASVSKHIQNLLNLCEEEIDNVQYELTSLFRNEEMAEDEVDYYQSRISELQANIQYCESSLSALRRQTPCDEADNERIQSEISSCEAECANYCSELSDAEQKLEEAEDRLSEIRDEISKKENKLSDMKMEFITVRTELSILDAEITKYCRYSAEQNGSNISSVNLCIKYLEEYISNNL